MDLTGTQEWTSYEITEFKALIAELRNESCDRMEALAKRFPAKTIEQLRDKYYEIFVDMLFGEIDEEPSRDDASSDLHDWYKLLEGETHDSVLSPSVEVLSPSVEVQPSKQLVFGAAEGEDMQRSHRQSSRKRRQAWTAEEHRLFLRGITCLGRGQWTFISRYFVPSRTPAQLASHAQKHFVRIKKNGQDDRRQRHTLNDVRLVNHDMNSTAHSCVEPENGKPNGSSISPPVATESMDMESLRFPWEFSSTQSPSEQGSVFLDPSMTGNRTHSCSNISLGAYSNGEHKNNRSTLPGLLIGQTPEELLRNHGAAKFEMVPINRGNLHLNVPPF